MNLTRCQEELEALGYRLELSNENSESWYHPDTGSEAIYYFHNSVDDQYFVRIQGFSKVSEIRAIKERLEELNDSIRPVYFEQAHYIKHDIYRFCIIDLNCYDSFVVKYPEDPCSITKCPGCGRPIDWNRFSHPDWWKEDNDEQS